LHGATLKNVVFVTTWMVDVRHIGPPANPQGIWRGRCRTAPGASVGVNAFAWHDMLLEIAAAAAVDKRARRSNSDQRARSFLFDDAP